MPTSRLRYALPFQLMCEGTVHHARALGHTMHWGSPLKIPKVLKLPKMASGILCTVTLVKKLETHSRGCILASPGNWPCSDELFMSTGVIMSVLQKRH